MPTLSLLPRPSAPLRNRLVEPSVFADLLVSRAELLREDSPEGEWLGLRNLQTGELLQVPATSFRLWMRTQKS